MQKAELILTKLNQKSKEDMTFKFRRLYRNLFNVDFYLRAYIKVHQKTGNMTKGINENTIDGFSINQIHNIIEKMKLEQFKPTPVRRTYISKKNGSNKQRPLGIPTFSDKIVQEVLRQLLEAIYEPLFSSNSHGFRPNKSCHTALMQLKRCNGTNWIIEGDISGYFDNIDHDILIGILKKKINDGRIIEIIRKFLKAGYMEQGIIKNTTTGTPQGGIISPILANIYLNELDEYMNYIINSKSKGNQRRKNKEYHNLASRKRYYLKVKNYEKANQLLKEMRKLNSRDMFDPNFQKIRYIRYADDFIVCINGSKNLADELKQDIHDFLKKKLKLELNKQKTLITNTLKNRIRFLGYDIYKAKDNTQISTTNKISRRSVNGVLQLLVPYNVITDKIKEFTKNGKAAHHNKRINLPVIEIINKYNSEIRGLYNYYKLANNVSTQLYRYKYYHYWSMLRTIGIKERIKVKQVIKKYGIDVPRKLGTGTIKVVGIKYQTKTETDKTLLYFNDSIKKSEIPSTWNVSPEPLKLTKCEVIKRLSKRECELCGYIGSISDFEIHHIKKIKVLKQQYCNRKNAPKWIQKMIKIKRRTLIVCKKCHTKIHS